MLNNIIIIAAAMAASPLPKCVEGYAILNTCKVDASKTENIADWVLIDPSAIDVITDPKDSPKNCVKIFLLTGRSLYVVGSYESVAAEVARAKKPCPK